MEIVLSASSYPTALKPSFSSSVALVTSSHEYWGAITAGHEIESEAGMLENGESQ